MQQNSSDTVWSWSGQTDNNFAEPNTNLRRLIETLEGDHSLFLTYYQNGLRLKQWTFHEFFETAHRLAVYLEQELGPEPLHGQCVAISSTNSDLLLLVYAACFLLECTIVPINPTESDHAMGCIVEHANCKVLITTEARSSISCRTLLFADIFSNISGSGDPRANRPRAQMDKSDAPAAIFYTSGTTSAPKGVVLSHRAILANIEALKAAHRLTHQSIHYCVLPLYHVNAFGFSFLTTLAARSQIVLSNRFQAEHFWQIIAAESCHTCNVVPEVVSQLLVKPAPDSTLMHQVRQSVQYFVSAASALSRDLLQRFVTKFSIKIVQGYGLSETVNFSLLVPPFIDHEEYRAVMFASPRPSAGVALAGNDVTVRRLSDDEPCDPGEVGEIVVRGWNVMSGYLKNPVDTATAFRHGWFRTGDLGYRRIIRGKEYFYISGRIKEIVKRKSETIYVQEIEENLQKIPGCSMSAVAGFRNHWTGEEIGAVIVREPATPDADAILHAAQELLGYDKAPKVIRFVEQIPRTGSLKVKRRVLSELFADLEATKFLR